MTDPSRQPKVTEIEVEVLEIDGEVPVSPSVADVGHAPVDLRADDIRHGSAGQDWNHWRGRVQQLDMRWWPLWGIVGLVLGAVALALLLTVGLVLGILVVILRLCVRVFRAIFR